MNRVWDPKRQSVREYLRQIRIESGLKQEQLAVKLNKPQSYVSKYENGERRLDFVETIEVCEACGKYDIETLIDLALSNKPKD